MVHENGPGIGAESPHAGGLAAKARFMAPEKNSIRLMLHDLVNSWLVRLAN